MNWESIISFLRALPEVKEILAAIVSLALLMLGAWRWIIKVGDRKILKHLESQILETKKIGHPYDPSRITFLEASIAQHFRMSQGTFRRAMKRGERRGWWHEVVPMSGDWRLGPRP